MAQLAVGQDTDQLKTLGLGSCVGICLHDSRLRLGGLVHIMLPEMSLYQDKNNQAKYADTGIRLLYREMVAAGASPSRLRCKLAGGAQMFTFAGQSDVMRIGQRNLAMTRQVVQELQIPVVAEHTGGNFGRTIQLDCQTGTLEVRTIGKGTFVI
jgi:chemotaxis protein CheD